jgi:hypothetical protein
MSHIEEIERLLTIAKETKDLKIVNNIIFNLAAYGPKSIPAINQIINDQTETIVRVYGRETIRRIKEQGGPCLQLGQPF